jgi:hypothetical protein
VHGALDDSEVGEDLLDRPLCAVGVNLLAKIGRTPIGSGIRIGRARLSPGYFRMQRPVAYLTLASAQPALERFYHSR